MRSLLILTILLVTNAYYIYCKESESKEEFIIVVNDIEEVLTTTDNPTNDETRNILPRYKSINFKNYEPQKKFYDDEIKNVTDTKIMYKFEAKDGRMKFQRDVDDTKTNESQTETYEPVKYEPVLDKPTKAPDYSYQQHPIMYFQLCPVHYDSNKQYVNLQPIYQIQHPTNSYRNSKQLVYYIPNTNSFARFIPSNYEGFGQNYQHYPKYAYQIYLPGHQVQGQESSNSEINSHEHNFQYGNNQYTSNVPNTKFNSVMYTDYRNGIDQTYFNHPIRSDYESASYAHNNFISNQNLRNQNNYMTSQHSEHSSNPYNDHDVQYTNNIFSTSHDGNSQKNFIHPTTGSSQVTEGNKYTGTASSNEYALANKDAFKYQNTESRIGIPDTSERTVQTNYPQIKHNRLKSGGGLTYVYSKENGKYVYYIYDKSAVDPKILAFESMKINVLNT